MLGELVVQDYQGRLKPLNSLAIEILNKLSVDNGVVGFIENKITELKNEIK